ncbi:MAG TPA: hypothetical protein GX707_00165, partial [Epulopiscium sp.]|nr:hypothetical protein [Candidatus Epulonipiscium sp.]
MDTKSKSIKYRLSTKIVAAFIMWVSLVGVLASSFFLLSNTDIIGTNSYEETYEYRMGMSRLIHNTVEYGTRYKHGHNKVEDSERYQTIQQNLSEAVNFNYYMGDLKTGDVSYKIRKGYQAETIKNQPNVIYIDQDTTLYSLYMISDIREMLIESPQELYISLNDPLVPGDMFYDIFTEFTAVKEIIPYATIALIGGLLLLLISFGYLLMASGKREKGGEVYLAEIDRIYNDLQSFFVFMAAVVSISIVASFGHLDIRYSPNSAIFITILAISAIIGMTYFFSMLRQFKKGVLFKNTLIWKVFSGILKLIRGCFNQRVFKIWLLGLMLLYAFINGHLFSFALNNRRGNFIFGSMLIIAFNIVAL